MSFMAALILSSAVLSICTCVPSGRTTVRGEFAPCVPQSRILVFVSLRFTSCPPVVELTLNFPCIEGKASIGGVVKKVVLPA